LTNAALELEQLIRQYVALGKRSPKGFEVTKCKACDDYKERGGFKFEAGSIVYSCFNCAAKAVYTEGHSVSKKFKDILKAFGIPADELERVVGKAFFTRDQGPKLGDPPKKPAWSPPKAVEPPKLLHDVTSDESVWCEVARAYLEVERGLVPAPNQFFVSDDRYLQARVIIPFTYRGQLIYWQARAIEAGVEPKYINPTTDKSKVFYNYDELSTGGSSALFLTEGPLDAISIGSMAVSLTGSTLSEWHLEELRKAAARGRKIVFVIDKNDNGLKLGKAALAEGWFVTVMPDNIDDANDGLKTHGRLWLLSHITSTAVSGFAGQVLLETKCEKKQKHSKRAHAS
jgi:hypothetical protein